MGSVPLVFVGFSWDLRLTRPTPIHSPHHITRRALSGTDRFECCVVGAMLSRSEMLSRELESKKGYYRAIGDFFFAIQEWRGRVGGFLAIGARHLLIDGERR